MFYQLGYLIAKVCTSFLCRVHLEGREHIPEQGPFLMVTNHLSWVDPPLLVSVMPLKLRITGMAARAHRQDLLIGWVMDHWGVVWVRRGESDREALRQALDMLASGRPFGVAPEGTRSRTGALIKGKTGITFLALKAQVPILPLALAGTDNVFSSTRRLFRTPVQVVISPTFLLPPRGDGPRREHIHYCTDLIMTRLASMLPKSYHGVYTDHPLIRYWEQLDASGMSNRPEWKPALDR
jgi:1-acyl-sn-glycerol-3-phosphate acyltransferase